jgi:hypothetical protein
VARHDGVGPAGASTPREARKAIRQQQPSSRTPHPNQQYAVSDGRTPLGTIADTVTGFTAVTTAGIVSGTFPTLREAAAALPGGGDR